MANTTEPLVLLKALQHNCTRGGQVMEALLESAVKTRSRSGVNPGA